jgi:hypothetical protein
MTPKEKAKELLFKKFGCKKQYSLIAVEEILNALSYKLSSNFEEIKYFVEVKQEIEKI